MINNSGNIFEDTLYKAYVNNQIPFFLNSAGYFQFRNENTRIERCRPDYYLIYILNGKGYYYNNDGYMEVSQGNILIYTPFQQQKYMYMYNDGPKCFWMHFTGHEVSKLLKRLDINSFISYVGFNNDIISIFELIINELQLKNPHYEDFCISKLIELLTLFSREKMKHNNQKYRFVDKDMEDVIKEMNINYMKNYDSPYYASIANMSEYGFIHKFKRIFGISPLKYIEKIRMDRASMLLKNTDMTIKEISYNIGYNDPLYFSKRFKLLMKKSPSKFRK